MMAISKKVCALLLLISLAGLFSCRAFRAAPTPTPAAQEVGVRRGNLEVMVTASGNLYLPNQQKLAFASPGNLQELLAEVGQEVKKGQVLARLEMAPLERAVRQAEANLENARYALDKAENPYKESDIARAQAQVASAKASLASAQDALTSAQAQLDDILAGADPKDVKLREEQLASAQASLASAQAGLDDILKGADSKEVALREAQLRAAQDSLDQARETLARATITAPFDGMVAATGFRAGEYAPANAAVLVLVDTSRLEVETLVDEQDIPRIRPGQEARTVLDALPAVTFQGQVKAVSPLAQRQAGLINYRVLLSLEGEAGAGITLREGLTVTAEILVDKRENVLLVPNRALSRRGQERLVKVVAGGRMEERVVTVGPSDGEYTEITSGLKEGEKVQVESSRSTPTPSPGGGFFFGR